MTLTRSVVAAAGLMAAPYAPPSLPASLPALTASPMSAPSVAPRIFAPVAPPSAAVPLAERPDLERLIERGWIRSGLWLIALREGRDAHGRRIMALDALDAGAPERGTVGHVDFALQGPGQPAVLDGPFDVVSDPARLPPGAGRADLSHWRMHLWFGFAVTPAFQGRGLGAVLLDLAAELAAREGAPELIIYATESSRAFYLARFQGRIAADEEQAGDDESTYHRIVATLPRH